MKILSSNIVFCIARKWRVSTLAKTFLITFRICFVIKRSPWIVLLFFARQCKKIKKAISFLKTSTVPCFIYTLQLVIKGSLFMENRIKLVLTKIQKLFAISGILKKATEMLKKSGKFCPRSKQKKIAKDTRWISTWMSARES